MIALAQMADTVPKDGNRAWYGLALAWWGPLIWLSVWLMHWAATKLGRGASVFYMVAVLICMAGLIPSLQGTPIPWSLVQIGLMIGGLALAALIVGFFGGGKPRLVPVATDDIGTDPPDMIPVASLIETYLSTLPADQIAALQTLRATLKSLLPDYVDCISDAMPGFCQPGPEGKMLAGYGAFARNCGFYPQSDSIIRGFIADLAP